MGKSNFPANDAPAGTPPCYTPEAFALRLVATAEGCNKVEWRKYPTRRALELGLGSLQHWAPSVHMPGPIRTHWVSGPFRTEIWEWFGMTSGAQWYLHETRIYRTDLKTGKREMFSA